MQLDFSSEALVRTFQTFKSRRDDLLHEDVAAFDHHLERFLQFCGTDPLVQSILRPLAKRFAPDVDAWWQEATERDGKLSFPTDPDEELLLRYRILESIAADDRRLFAFGFAQGQRKRDDGIGLFRTLVVRPLVDDLSLRIGNAVNLATPEARAVQAVPLERIPSSAEVRIFLSHKSVDKPLVRRYYNALKGVGFDPWLDEPDMPAGSNLEREVLRGFSESCAAVFFITENFKDERYLAAEVDYAVMQKRKRDKKFAIITLRYTNAASVPELLTPYTYKDVANDLEGYCELLRALPIELGPVRWKAAVIR